MIAFTQYEKLDMFSKYNICFECERGKVSCVLFIELILKGHSPRLKYNVEGDLIGIESTSKEGMYVTDKELAEFKIFALEKLAEFKKEHLS